MSEAQKKAVAKYRRKAYDILSINVPKGEREIFKDFAAAAKLSLAQYVRAACYEKAGQRVPTE